MALALTSAEFEHGGSIPRKYTCEGDDVSPPLRWDGVPGDVQSLALIVEDPDAPDPEAPKMTYVHFLGQVRTGQVNRNCLWSSGGFDSDPILVRIPARRDCFEGPCQELGFEAEVDETRPCDLRRIANVVDFQVLDDGGGHVSWFPS